MFTSYLMAFQMKLLHFYVYYPINPWKTTQANPQTHKTYESLDYKEHQQFIDLSRMRTKDNLFQVFPHLWLLDQKTWVLFIHEFE